MPLSGLGLNRGNWFPCYFIAIQSLGPWLYLWKVKAILLLFFFFSVIISAYSTSLIIQALSAMCDFLEISKPPKLFIIIIIIIKAIKSNYLTHILPIFIAYLQQMSMGLFTTSAQLRSPLNQSISGMSFNFRLHPLKWNVW